MAILAEAIWIGRGRDERRRSRFRWDLKQFVAEIFAEGRAPIADGRLRADLRQKLAKLLQRHRLYREALDADKLMHRAVDWLITRERIKFSIERHPLGVVLFQTWVIDVRNGTFVKIREKYLGLQRSRSVTR